MKRILYFCVALLLSHPVAAGIVTYQGQYFDVIYDSNQTGLFGDLTLQGNNIFFTPNQFVATSSNGQGLAITSSTVSGIRLVAKDGFKFGSIMLQEFGDYLLVGDNSLIGVYGQLRAFDPSNPFATQTSSNLTMMTELPLNLNDGQLHDWGAVAFIDAFSASVMGTNSGWIAQTDEIMISIENILSAYTSIEAGPQAAFIEKKFAGVGLTIASAIPEPGIPSAFISGLLMVAAMMRRRNNTV